MKVKLYSLQWVKKHCNKNGYGDYKPKNEKKMGDFSLIDGFMTQDLCGKVVEVAENHGFNRFRSTEDTPWIIPNWLIKKVVEEEKKEKYNE